jgi:leader peptidase (prepilin peptidase) / N-methyltransferase
MPPLEAVQAGIFGIIGLLVGSFLNVVIHRLPKMMVKQWAAEVAEYNGQNNEESKADNNDERKVEAPSAEAVFNLMLPRSRCPTCSHQIQWYENIPIVSYLFLRGKCSACKTPISMRYPTIEVVTGALFFYCIWNWGLTATGLAWCGFSAALLSLSMIDWDTTLLPDDMTLPLLWAGLLLAAMKVTTVSLESAVWGAAAGYFSLWLIYWAFKLITGKEGMGYGDFKLFAALGAWFGWQALIPIILMASVIGAVIGIALKFSNNLREGGYIPFGPFLGIAGFSAMFFGSQAILKLLGLAPL